MLIKTDVNGPLELVKILSNDVTYQKRIPLDATATKVYMEPASDVISIGTNKEVD